MKAGIDKTAVLIAVVGALPATLTAGAALLVSLNTNSKVEKVEHATNSMKDALVKAALMEGEVIGAAKEKSRADTATANQAKGAEAARLKK